MRLNDKYTIWFSAMCLSVLLLGILTIHQVGQSATRRAYINQLESLNDTVANQLRQNRLLRLPDNIYVQGMRVLPENRRSIVVYRVQRVSNLMKSVSTINLTSFREINGKWYRITSFLPAIGMSGDYLYPMIMVVAWLLVFFSMLVVIFSKVISWYILSPFQDTLRDIKDFEEDHEHRMDSEPTSTSEFRFLNSALIKMTNRVRTDLDYLKEFSKYGIHELKTPAANISVKLRMLVQHPLEYKQRELIGDMELQLKKLERLNDSLELLADLKSGVYQKRENINFSNEVMDALDNFQDWMDDEGITLVKEIKPDIWLSFHEKLIERLLPNIFSNAIKHNKKNGVIEVKLDESGLRVRNTTQDFAIAPDCTDARSTSGLKILKAICDVSNLTLRRCYGPEAGWHFTEIQFDGQVIPGAFSSRSEPE